MLKLAGTLLVLTATMSMAQTVDDLRYRLRSFTLPTHLPTGVAWDGVDLFLSNTTGFRRLWRLDPRDGSVLDSILAPSATGLDGRGNALDITIDDAGFLFVADLGRDDVGVIYEVDYFAQTIVNQFELPFRAGAIAFDGQRLYIGDWDSDLMLVTNRNGNERTRLRTGLRPSGMTFYRGSLWIVETFNPFLTEMTPDGQILGRCLTPRAGARSFDGVVWVDGEIVVTEVTDRTRDDPPFVPGTAFVFGLDETKCW